MTARQVVVALLSALSASSAAAQVAPGGEFRVNTYTTNSQSAPDIAADAAGNFIVVWNSRQDGGADGIFAQRYDAGGAPRGDEFRVNTYTTGSQYAAFVAMDASGAFVVAWSSRGQDGDVGGIFARRYDASGTPLGSEFRVNTYTVSYQRFGTIAMDGAGDFVVVWQGYGSDGSGWGIFGQRYDAAGTPRGAEFQVNSHSTGHQRYPAVAAGATGGFVVAWTSYDQDGSGSGVFAQRYDASGVPRGAEFQVNTFTSGSQAAPSVAWYTASTFVVAWNSLFQDGSGFGIFGQRYDTSGARLGVEFRANTDRPGNGGGAFVAADGAGDFVVVWDNSGQDGSGLGVFGQRFDGSAAAQGAELQVNTYTTEWQFRPSVAFVSPRNLVVAWVSREQDGDGHGVFGRRLGGMLPAAVAVDPTPTPTSDGNRVLEPGESVDVRPSWRNRTGGPQTFDGTALGFVGPAAAGVTYELLDGAATYGTVPDGATITCGDCYRVGMTFGGTRPGLHWDAKLTETLVPDVLGETKPWSLHVGESFTDVPKTSAYYRFVETLLHKNITGGCAASEYCPASAVTREQVSVFTLEAREGAAYGPPPCGAVPLFADVPASSFFCPWIEELARRGVVGGCGGGNFCPRAPVLREQLPVFVLRLQDPTLDPPPCTTPIFSDVPASSPYCRWIEELARRGVIVGCGGGNYCPTASVTREQMAVFISVTYGLTLYAP